MIDDVFWWVVFCILCILIFMLLIFKKKNSFHIYYIICCYLNITALLYTHITYSEQPFIKILTHKISSYHIYTYIIIIEKRWRRLKIIESKYICNWCLQNIYFEKMYFLIQIFIYCCKLYFLFNMFIFNKVIMFYLFYYIYFVLYYIYNIYINCKFTIYMHII